MWDTYFCDHGENDMQYLHSNNDDTCDQENSSKKIWEHFSRFGDHSFRSILIYGSTDNTTDTCKWK